MEVKIEIGTILKRFVISVECDNKTFDFSGRGITEINLSGLTNYRELEHVLLRKNYIEKIELSPLRKLRDLKQLRLDKNQLKSIDLSPLEGSYIEILILADNPLKDIDLSPLIHCNKLKELNLSDIRLDSLDLGPLGRGPSLSLQYLRFDWNRIKEIDLWPISSCSELVDLSMSENAFQEIDLSPLGKCHNLRHIGIGNNPIKTIDLKPLSFCKKLQTIYLAGNQIKNIDLSPLQYCSELDSLWLENNMLQTINLSPLSQCFNLESFDIQGNMISKIDLSPLFSCMKLSHFYIDESSELYADMYLKEQGILPPAIEKIHDKVQWIKQKEVLVVTQDPILKELMRIREILQENREKESEEHDTILEEIQIGNAQLEYFGELLQHNQEKMEKISRYLQDLNKDMNSNNKFILRVILLLSRESWYIRHGQKEIDNSIASLRRDVSKLSEEINPDKSIVSKVSSGLMKIGSGALRIPAFLQLVEIGRNLLMSLGLM